MWRPTTDGSSKTGSNNATQSSDSRIGTDRSSVARRGFLNSAVAATALTIAGCMDQNQSDTTHATETWPTPKDGQKAVMPLGSIHLDISEDGERGNIFVFDPGDVLGERRQAELAELTEQVGEWDPNRVAVEWPVSEQAALDTAYEAYQDDDLETVEEILDPRSEIVQIGFRLAAARNHDGVLATDAPQDLFALMSEDEREKMAHRFEQYVETDKHDEFDYPVSDPYSTTETHQQELDDNTLIDFYRMLNSPAQHRINDELIYTVAFEESEVGAYVGVKLLTAWYQRNLRITSNLWNGIEETDDRVVLLYGASHVPGIRHMLNLAPMFAPVNPQPYLTH